MGDEGHSLQVERQECGRELGPAWMLMWEPLFPHWDTQKVHRTITPCENRLSEPAAGGSTPRLS